MGALYRQKNVVASAHCDAILQVGVWGELTTLHRSILPDSTCAAAETTTGGGSGHLQGNDLYFYIYTYINIFFN